jgi:putative aldouronate transport system permease protein
LIGSANASLQPMTDIIETYVYRTLMNQFNFPYSAAAGLYQSVVGFAIVMAANYVVNRVDPDYALF